MEQPTSNIADLQHRQLQLPTTTRLRFSWVPGKSWTVGLCLIALSMLLFAIPKIVGVRNDTTINFFFIHYLLFLGYGIGLCFGSKARPDALKRQNRYLLLVLGLIAAFALNRDLPVFQESTTWLCMALVTGCSAGILLPFIARMPRPLQQLLVALNAAAALLWLYYTLFLMPLYPISVLGLLALGISIHSFIPALLLTSSCTALYRTVRSVPRLWAGATLGAASALAIVIVFCAQWAYVHERVRNAAALSKLQGEALPEWTLIAQQIPQNLATESYLKSDAVYSMFSPDWLDWGIPSRGLDEPHLHDPIVAIAAILMPPVTVGLDDRLRMLDVRYDARHKTEERLWSGAHLRTGSISTQARIWPAQRLAYQEQIITVRNTAKHRDWGSGDEEALYTMQLPEGSAVTSLSLWIEGEERPARLSSRGKADNAYRNIVGYERRDPSLVRWMEGNRVTIRVFPVPLNGERRFKIGVTTPVLVRNGRIHFEPLRFEGPDASGAAIATRIRVEGAALEPEGAADFRNTSPGVYEYAGRNRELELSMSAPPLEPARFSFNGNTYTLSDASGQRSVFRPKYIRLDLNAAWSRSEYNEICEALKEYPLYAGAGDTRIRPDNRDEVFDGSVTDQFSVFPFFRIGSPEETLVITHSTERSPNLSDLAGSGFATALGAAAASGRSYRVFELGGRPSPYLGSLRERRILTLESGAVADVARLLREGRFASSAETPNSIVIGEAGLRITKTAGAQGAEGPDHLLRLYNYNDIIRHLGRRLYENMESDSTLQRQADEAYVVSPISSLIVLKTEADYQRHGIHRQGSGGKTLGNAGIGNSGAVPEPHEWALIIIALCTLAWMKRTELLKRLITRRA